MAWKCRRGVEKLSGSQWDHKAWGKSALRFRDCTEICLIVEGADDCLHCISAGWLKRVFLDMPFFHDFTQPISFHMPIFLEIMSLPPRSPCSFMCDLNLVALKKRKIWNRTATSWSFLPSNVHAKCYTLLGRWQAVELFGGIWACHRYSSTYFHACSNLTE